MLKLLAIVNILFGPALVFGALTYGIKASKLPDGSTHTPTLVLAIALTIMGAAFVLGGVSFFKEKTTQRALRVAKNSAAILAIGVAMMFHVTGVAQAIAPTHLVIALAVAFLSYRFTLRPIALRTCPPQQPTENSPTV